MKKRIGIFSRLVASFSIENALDQAAKKKYGSAIDLVQKAIVTSQDRSLEARLLEGHCHWRLGNMAEATMSFARVREMMENAKKLSPHDRDYLLRYAMSHFKNRAEISPFSDMEVPEPPSLEKVTKRFKTQFPMKGKE